MASFETDLEKVTDNFANVTIGDVIDKVTDNRDNLLLLIKACSTSQRVLQNVQRLARSQSSNHRVYWSFRSNKNILFYDERTNIISYIYIL